MATLQASRQGTKRKAPQTVTRTQTTTSTQSQSILDAEADGPPLRTQFSNLSQKLQDDHDAMTDPSRDTLTKRLKYADELAQNVSTARDAICDANVFSTMAQLGRKQAQNLVQAHKISVAHFVQGVSTRFATSIDNTESRVDWAKLGFSVAPLLQQTPTFCSINGPLGDAVKQRKVPERTQRAQRDDTPKTTAVVPKSGAQGDTGLAEHTHRIKKLHEVLESQSSQGCADALPFVTNPSSFSETIENLFDLSFLVRDGDAKIDLQNDTIVVSSSVRPKRKDEMPTNQCIVRIDFNAFQQLGKETPEAIIKREIIPSQQ